MKYTIRKRKRGTEYQRVVAEVVRVFDCKAKITEGQWLVGPDGRRELDVMIEGTADDRPTKGIIECKDFDPKTTGPVGIVFIDALDSKRRDLGADFSLMCSNAGFTTDAMRKAKRVGIGLISVMKKGDRRIRFSVKEEIYTRKIKLGTARIVLTGVKQIVLDNVKPDQICFEGLPVANWILHRIPILVAANPIVNGMYTATHALTTPLLFNWPGGSAEITKFGFTFAIEGAWLAHQGEIDSTAGFYDWLRRRARVASRSENKLEFKGIDLDNGTRISLPPDRELIRERFLKDEVDMKLVLFENFPDPGSVPDLNKFIVPHDLDPLIPELPPEAVTSSSLSEPLQSKD